MKTVKEERLVISLVLERAGGEVNVSCRAVYDVTSEGVTEGRSFCPVLTTSQETVIKSFASNVLGQIKTLEG